MKPLEIKKGIYWVGAVDWNIRTFHGNTYSSRRGTTYNSYLIVDEKITLVDGIYAPFAQESIEKIKEIIPPGKIDYIIANHLETDHSGSIPGLLEICPKAKVYCTQKFKEGFYRMYYRNADFQVVKTGDKLKLGRRTLTFIEAPMIHWPDSMFTYCVEEELLMPNDAFGQHYATSERFDDETDQCALMDEAAKYYANILWPLGSLILKKIEEIQKLGIPIKMIAPSHGIIWRKDPMKIVNAYISWAKNTTKPKVVIAYETMWGATDRMARSILDGLSDNGLTARLFDISQSDRTEVIGEMLDARGYIIGSSTHDNDMLPSIAAFLEFLKGLKPKNRLAAVFGSYGWSGGAVASIENALKETGIEIVQPSISVKYMPDENETRACYEFGVNFAKEMVK